MAISLIALPYSHEALVPHISAQTLKLHHGAHHKGYVDKTNAAIAGTGLEQADLNEIVKTAKSEGKQALFNNAAQAWNHGFYWHSLSPRPSQPSAELAQAIERDFGSSDAMIAKLKDEGAGHFASGWAWLVAEDGRLKVISTHDADTPITGAANPLLTVDVWEHAYYLDVQNKRPDYLAAVVDNVLNWEFASENFARGTAWRYPA